MKSALSTYRSLLREAGRLPHIYLRQFFRLKTRQYFRENVATKQHRPQLVYAKLRKARAELRKLQRANGGDRKALAHVLDLAYGRKGKLKHELMKHFLSNSTVVPPPRIIPSVERSRPPSYSPELTTLLTSIYARMTKPLKPSALHTPPTLPERANPASEEARLLGPFSRRREVNIRWRYHTGEVSRTLPPLELTKQDGVEGSRLLRETGAEELQLLRDVERLARSPHQGSPMPRRERKSSASNQDTLEPFQSRFDSLLPTRFFRRRYRELLSRIPILTPSDESKTGCTTTLSPLALSHATRGDISRLGYATEDDAEWIARAENMHKRSKKSNTKQI